MPAQSVRGGKNIIICSDGTGNTAIKGRGTNVFKIFESIDLNGHRFNPDVAPQVAIYDDGVGTEDWKVAKVFSGAFGYGLGRNVRQLYKELCRIYDHGDRIYLFGFSRGAFTVRTLAGLIARCGIINVAKVCSGNEFEEVVGRAYAAYRDCYRTALMRRFRGKLDGKSAAEFSFRYCHPPGRIHFIGVWDTVDSVGLPLRIADVVNSTLYAFKFPNLELSDRVDHAYHALSIDDDRRSFHPLLWDERNRRGKEGETNKQVLEQVWFAGVHSNVGGGYAKQGMSLVALDWMMGRAEASGLRFVAAERAQYRDHANVDDKLYDPRSGLGVFYRWAPRDVESLCAASGMQPALHLSVLERIAHGTDDYCPGNLPPNAKVVISPTGELNKDAAAMHRANEAQAVLMGSHRDGGTLLNKVRHAVRIGQNSHRVFLTTCLGLVAFALASNVELALSWAYPWQIAKALWQQPMVLSAIIVGYLISATLAYYTDSRMLGAFSQFWFLNQQQLRAALKRARKAAQQLDDQGRRGRDRENYLPRDPANASDFGTEEPAAP
ncbi:MAG TPA: DUF2235 domain-containing protein [Steroidobacteraceae bacterium]|nr:DUF2235 domain-containing protein [Steroidobacteraceae bacterium]